MNILISACLIGLYCRYDGKIKDYPAISKLFNRPDITLIPCCPEQAGGLPTPRMAAERCGQQVKTCDDRNVTEQFEVGARTACRLAELYNCSYAVLKEKSPFTFTLSEKIEEGIETLYFVSSCHFSIGVN